MTKNINWVPTPTFLYRNSLYQKIVSNLSKNSKFLLIGTGSAYFLKKLEKLGFSGVAIDISSESVAYAKKVLGKNKITVLKRDILNYKSTAKFDFVFCFEVIEHIKNDQRALKNIYKLLKPGGSLVLSVPAHMSAWGKMDEIGGHFRRYEKKGLIKLLSKKRFVIDKFWSYGFPFLNVVQRVSRTGAFVKDFNRNVSITEKTKKSGIRTDADPRFSFLYSNKALLYPFFVVMNLFVNTDLGFGYIVVAKRPKYNKSAEISKSIRKNYALFNSEILDVEGRSKIARQILKVLSLFYKTKKDPRDVRVLDIGCSSGVITNYLAQKYGKVVGIDVDKDSIDMARHEFKRNNLNFFLRSGDKTGFPESSFDIVIANQVYYCFSRPEKFFDEIYRLLKPGGVCYFGGRNKYTLWDPQYRLPLLSILPKKVADYIVRIAHRSDKFEAEYRTYWQLEKMSNKFEIEKLTPKAIHNYKKYGFEKFKNYKILFSSVPEFMWTLAEPILPNFVWILTKSL